MTIDQLTKVNRSNFNFIKQAILDYALHPNLPSIEIISIVNDDYAGGWDQYRIDCLFFLT